MDVVHVNDQCTLVERQTFNLSVLRGILVTRIWALARKSLFTLQVGLT